MANKKVKKSNPKVFIVIVNTNGGKHIFDCLDSLKKVIYRPFSVIVVDNNSTDGSREKIEKRYPRVVLLKNSDNLGFTGANNRGMKYAVEKGAQYVLLLNDDTEVKRDFLSELIKQGEARENVGILGSKIFFASPATEVWFAGGRINRLKCTGEHLFDGTNDNKPIYCEFITGCCFCIKREVIEEIGFLNDDLFIYHEDADFCIRAINADFKILYVPSSVLWHKISQTSKKKSYFYYYLTTRNLLYNFKKFKSYKKSKFTFTNPIYYLLARFIKNFIVYTITLDFKQLGVLVGSQRLAYLDAKNSKMGKPPFLN